MYLLHLHLGFRVALGFILLCRLTHLRMPDAVPVRKVSGLPRASFRFRLATDTLAFGYALGATSCARDLHPLDHAHAGRTKANAGNPWYGFLRPLRGSVAALDHGWLSPLRHQHPAESIVRNKFFARRSDFSFF